MQVKTISTLRVGSLLAGNNPRTYFDPAEMSELESSIAANGVIQPILVRPVEGGGYAVVAGERRWRAAAKVRGDDYEIPVLVKDITSEEADELALIENIARANMSATEEAAAASKILGRSNGDREEAAKRLGWSLQKLNSRLALMNCSPSVQKALNERKIQLGHAELLAAVSKEKQESVISKMLAAPLMPTVALLKAQLESIAKALSAAIFPMDECAGCHHNSGNQGALFAEAVSSGHCTNGECYDKKTDGALEAKKKSLEENYPRVHIFRPGENNTVIKIVAEGATGVGEAQSVACKGCKSYGGGVSAVPGKMGQVYEGLCFDTACNATKVADRIKAEKEAAKPKSPAAKAEGAKPAAGNGAEKSPAKPAVKPAVTKVQDSTRVVDYRIKIWRAALKKELYADHRENLSMLIGILMTRGGSHVAHTKLSGAFEKLTNEKVGLSNVGLAAAAVSRATDEVRNQMLSGVVVSMMDGIEKNHLPEMLTFMEVDMAKHFKLNAEFLDLLTKSEIEVVADEIGLRAAMGNGYTKAIIGKKDDLIKTLLAVEGFDYVGKIPSVLQYAAV